MRPRPPLASQNGEDYLLLTAFGSQDRGFFIDVGAFDGVHLSNTWALEQIGWQGICVEPSRRVFPILAANRPRSVCIEAAVGSSCGKATLHMDPTMLLSSLGPKETVEAAFERAAEFRGLEEHELEEIQVEVVTLNDLLRRSGFVGQIDLMSVDVEGAEEDVLDGFDLMYYKPRVILIEANDSDAKERLTTRLTAAGYEYCRSVSNNLFFSHDPVLIQSLRRTPLDCFIPRNIHPFGLDYTHPDQREDRILLRGRKFTFSDLLGLVAEEGKAGSAE